MFYIFRFSFYKKSNFGPANKNLLMTMTIMKLAICQMPKKAKDKRREPLMLM